MLTKNFYIALANASVGFLTNDKPMTQTNGTAEDFYGTQWKFNAFPNMKSFTNIVQNSGVQFGSGKTPATADDYKLESQITSGLTVANPGNISRSCDDDGIHMSCTFGVKNADTKPVEISEIGMVASFNTSGSSYSGYFLVERTVLETPIVIPVGESRQITYTISFRYPTA